MKTPTSERIDVQRDLKSGNSDSTAQLEQQSQELAHEDGRAEARDSDRELALRELTMPDGDPAQEVPSGAEGLVTWDVSPEESGHLIPETPAEDEADVPAELAEEGSGEAEQELRRAVNTEAHLHRNQALPG